MKQHSVWRNVGSWFTNKMTDWALDKPPGFYLSSFRCVSAFVAQQVVTYAGPYPYIDGLILQVTQRIGSIDVRHEPRTGGGEHLHAAAAGPALDGGVGQLLGAAAARRHGARPHHCRRGDGALGVVVAWLWLRNVGPSYGFGWLMAALLVFSGTQLVLLGLIGEYIGRTFLTINQRPQSVVRDVFTTAAALPSANGRRYTTRAEIRIPGSVSITSTSSGPAASVASRAAEVVAVPERRGADRDAGSVFRGAPRRGSPGRARPRRARLPRRPSSTGRLRTPALRSPASSLRSHSRHPARDQQQQRQRHRRSSSGQPSHEPSLNGSAIAAHVQTNGKATVLVMRNCFSGG